MAEGGALLRRYGGEFLHRGFESLLLRYWFGFHQFFRKLRRVTRSTRGRCPFGAAGSGAGDRPAWSRRGRGPSALGARPCRPGSTRGTGQRTLLVVHAHGWRRLPWRFQHKRCAPKPGRNCCSQFGSGGSCFGLLDQFDEPLPGAAGSPDTARDRFRSVERSNPWLSPSAVRTTSISETVTIWPPAAAASGPALRDGSRCQARLPTRSAHARKRLAVPARGAVQVRVRAAPRATLAGESGTAAAEAVRFRSPART